MNICKADAVAQLSKWYNAGTRVQATYRKVIKPNGSSAIEFLVIS